MKDPLFWMDAALWVLGGLAFCYLLLSNMYDVPHFAKLAGRLCWTLVFVLMAAEDLRPMSRQLTVTGEVEDFRQVGTGRSAEFEFAVVGPNSRPTVRTGYFDPGFFFGDPALEDGDTVQITYMVPDGEAIKIRELSGRHPEWKYQAHTRPIVPFMFLLIGLAIASRAVIGFNKDQQANRSMTENA